MAKGKSKARSAVTGRYITRRQANRNKRESVIEHRRPRKKR